MIQQRVFHEYWPAIFGLLLGLTFCTFQIVGFDLQFFPGDLGDARFNMYLLEHAHRYFFIGDVPTERYWDAPFIYPQESIISFSDNLLGSFIIYSLFRFLGQDTATAFQLWFIGITALNYMCSYVFFKFTTKNKFTSAVGALIFTFSIALISQYAHAQTFPRFAIPIAFLFALKFNRTFKVKYLFLAVLFVVFQFYCVLYLGFMLTVSVGIYLLVSMIQKWKTFIKVLSVKWLLLSLSSLAVNLLFLFPMIKEYMDSPAMIKEEGIITERPYSLVFDSIPTLKSYFFIQSKSACWSWLNNVGTNLPAWWDHQLFLGGIVLLSIAFFIVYALKRLLSRKRFKNKEHLTLLITAVLVFLLFIRGEESSLYQYLYEIPGFGSMVAIQRIINIELLFFAALVIYVYRYLSKEVKNKSVFFLGFCVLFVVDNYVYSSAYPKVDKNQAAERIQNLKEELDGIEKGALFSYEPYTKTEQTIFYHLDAMLAGQQLGLKVMNGYTSTVPLGYYYYAVNLDESGRKEWIKKAELGEDVHVVQSALPEEVIRIIEQIKNQEDWFIKVKKSAEEKGISLEESLLENALWVYRENKKKAEEHP